MVYQISKKHVAINHGWHQLRAWEHDKQWKNNIANKNIGGKRFEERSTCNIWKEFCELRNT
jgi:hypothetical protein